MSVFDEVRARLARALAPALARIGALVEGLSARDRKLLAGLSAAAVLAVVAAVGWWMSATLRGLEERIADRTAAVKQVEELQSSYEGARDKVQALEKELKRSEGTDLSAFLEKAAATAQIGDRLAAVREVSTSRMDDLEQKNYSVSVSRVSLEQLLSFLYEVETGGYPLRIRSTEVKTLRSHGEKLLNVKLDVASWRLANEEG